MPQLASAAQRHTEFDARHWPVEALISLLATAGILQCEGCCAKSATYPELIAGLSGIAPQRKSLRHLTDHGQTQTQGPRCRIAPDQLTTMRISQGK
ncbi:MAG: hypothetical protein EBX67_04675 [Betaproteobacteria bacterium]|nr:hypothetical protein [Betaproteobacteria bacterium]